MFGFFRTGSLLAEAKTLIGNGLKRLNFPTKYCVLDVYLPDEPTTKRLVAMAVKSKFSAHDLALMLVDSGYAHQRAIDAAAGARFNSAFGKVSGEFSGLEQTLTAASAGRHDDLLSEVFKEAVNNGCELVPQYGSVGSAMHNALGGLIEPVR